MATFYRVYRHGTSTYRKAKKKKVGWTHYNYDNSAMTE